MVGALRWYEVVALLHAARARGRLEVDGALDDRDALRWLIGRVEEHVHAAQHVVAAHRALELGTRAEPAHDKVAERDVTCDEEANGARVVEQPA